MARATPVAVADEGDGLTIELGEDLVERVLEDRRIAVVVTRPVTIR